MASGARGTRSGVEPRVLAMIGVIADPADHNVVREFFELFKTPWDFYRQDCQYDVVLCAGDVHVEPTAKLVVFFAGKNTDFDVQHNIQTGKQRMQACTLLYQGNRIPIYGDTLSFSGTGNTLLKYEDSRECAAYQGGSEERVLVRIGYDLFSEINTLLTAGQPEANANLPALELHIAFLRNLITGVGITLVEIPPVPEGYRFIACLTHDVDHPTIRQHKWDHTVFGFLYRAIFGSLRNFIRGRKSGRDLLANWAAALKLPFVYLRLAKDFWRNFDDRYLKLEGGRPSTYFVIPSRNNPGLNSTGRAPYFRAAGYEGKDIVDAIRKLRTAGCEVGLHGIDAWRDSTKGKDELETIRSLTGDSEIGVRMHWLYYDQQSPAMLEAAGASYDSTLGYNGTVGYRAGTTQAYKPLNVIRMLELPLHIMDSAMFFPDHLDLSPKEAKKRMAEIVENAVRFGGALTINWHDRSIAPERQWGGSYRDLIDELKDRGAWFATAGQTVSWFRKRRSATFETDSFGAVTVRAQVPFDRNSLPGLRLRVYKGCNPKRTSVHNSEAYADMAVDNNIETSVPSQIGS